MNKISLTFFTILFFGLLSLSSCGGGDAKTEPAKTTTAETTPAETTPAETTPAETTNSGTSVISLSGDDKMKYNKSELKVKAGTKVTLTFSHTGKMPITAMGHNFVLLKPGTDMAEFAKKAMAAKDNGYIPEGDDIIAHTKMIGGGESVEITFDAPAAGTYDYICSYPGHYGIMKGKFIVE